MHSNSAVFSLGRSLDRRSFVGLVGCATECAAELRALLKSDSFILSAESRDKRKLPTIHQPVKGLI